MEQMIRQGFSKARLNFSHRKTTGRFLLLKSFYRKFKAIHHNFSMYKAIFQRSLKKLSSVIEKNPLDQS